MALDGFTQLFGWRESTWELRVVTGSLFALAVAWFVFPRLQRGFGEIQQTVEQRFERLVREGRAAPL
jgi:predicted MFS family arabinose efflux permease